MTEGGKGTRKGREGGSGEGRACFGATPLLYIAYLYLRSLAILRA